jgi:hypothetical protein
MTYLALLESLGAIYHMPYNNNGNHTTYGTEVTNVTVASSGQNFVFSPDAPAALGTTHSARIGGLPTIYNGTTVSPVRKRIFVATTAVGQPMSMTVWLKQGQVAAGTNLPSITLLSNTQSSANTFNDTTTLLGGTWNNWVNESINNFSGIFRPTSNLTSTVLQQTLRPEHFEFPNDNEWHNFTLVCRAHQTNNSQAWGTELMFYFDGLLISYRYIPNAAWRGWGTGSGGYIETPSWGHQQAGGETGPYRQVSNFTIFKGALSPEQVRQIAWYNKPNLNYNDVVMADNPIYFTPLNNIDNTVDPEAFGTSAATWGPLNDTGVQAGVEGVLGRGWYVNGANNTTNPVASTTTPAMMTDLNNLIAGTGNFSIEFWAKIANLPGSGFQENLLGTNNSDNQGRLGFTVGNTGFVSALVTQRSGATTYAQIVVGNNSGDIPAIPSANANDFYSGLPGELFKPIRNQPVNAFADNEWHHFVLTVEKDRTFNSAAGGFRYHYNLYHDGAFVGSNTAINTNGQIAPSTPQSWFRIGFTGLGATNGTSNFTIDKIAFYNYALREEQIVEHVLAGKFLIASNQGAVKYWNGTDWVTSSAQKVWNGTEWIDWDHKYWNGTAWIDL